MLHERSVASTVGAVRVGFALEQQLDRSVLTITRSLNQRGRLELLPRPVARELGPLVHHRRPVTVQQLAQLAAVTLFCGDAQLLACGHRQLCTAASTVWAPDRARSRSAAQQGEGEREENATGPSTRARQTIVDRSLGSNLCIFDLPPKFGAKIRPRATDLGRVAVAAAALFKNTDGRMSHSATTHVPAETAPADSKSRPRLLPLFRPRSPYCCTKGSLKTSCASSGRASKGRASKGRASKGHGQGARAPAACAPAGGGSAQLLLRPLVWRHVGGGRMHGIEHVFLVHPSIVVH
jgi:hypothetical protein